MCVNYKSFIMYRVIDGDNFLLLKDVKKLGTREPYERAKKFKLGPHFAITRRFFTMNILFRL